MSRRAERLREESIDRPEVQGSGLKGRRGRDEIDVKTIPTLFQTRRMQNSILIRNGRDIIFGTEAKGGLDDYRRFEAFTNVRSSPPIPD